MLQTVRGLVRPVVTLIVVLALTAFEGFSVFVLSNKVSQEYVVLAGGVIGWWFYSRNKVESKPE